MPKSVFRGKSVTGVLTMASEKLLIDADELANDLVRQWESIFGHIRITVSPKAGV